MTSIQPDFLLLQRDLTAPVPAPAWPRGVALAPLEATDAEAIHTLLQRAYANGFGSVLPDWLDWWEMLLADSEFDRQLCFIAKADGEPVGFCACWSSSFVKDLVVDPSRHGLGIGAALLDTAMTALRDRGATELRLKVITANTGARRLYARAGFTG